MQFAELLPFGGAPGGLPALVQALTLARSQGLKTYALVDGALQQGIRTDEQFRRHCLPILPEGFASTPEDTNVLPQLCPLGALSDSALEGRLWTQYQWALQHHCATWMVSELDPAALQQALAARMAAELEGGVSVLLRWADARVLPVLAEVLTEAQRALLFAGVHTWWYLDRNRTLQALCVATAESRSSEASPSSFQLTQQQEDRMLAAARADEVDRILRTHAPDASSLPQEHAARHAWIQACIERAAAWGIASELDLALFCLMDLDLGSDFEQAPEWRERLAQVKLGLTSLKDLL